MDVRKSDRKTLILCLFNLSRIWPLLLAIGLSWLLWSFGLHLMAAAVLLVSSGVYAYLVREDFHKSKWKCPEFRSVWDQIIARKKSLASALKKAPEFVREAFQSTPSAVERTQRKLYQSTRIADLVKAEINKSEQNLGNPRALFGIRSNDQQTSELYLQADKNAAEYRKYYDKVWARVTRVEAQCAVFASALDALRIRLLGYRLLSKDDRTQLAEFDQTAGEIEGQLTAIDAALKELELFPDLHAEPETQVEKVD